MCTASDVTLSSEIVLLLLPLASGPRVKMFPASHTKRSVSASTCYQQLYFLLVQGEHLPVKTRICQSSGGSDNQNGLYFQGRNKTGSPPTYQAGKQPN